MKKLYYELVYFYHREILLDKNKKGMSMIYDSLRGVLDCVETDCSESDNPNEAFYKLRMVKMTESEFENLPDFEGY